jgi:ribosomal protein L34E
VVPGQLPRRLQRLDHRQPSRSPSRPYSAAICARSVTSAVAAVGWQAAKAACTW